jgi:hypothetical protein
VAGGTYSPGKPVDCSNVAVAHSNGGAERNSRVAGHHRPSRPPYPPAGGRRSAGAAAVHHRHGPPVPAVPGECAGSAIAPGGWLRPSAGRWDRPDAGPCHLPASQDALASPYRPMPGSAARWALPGPRAWHAGPWAGHDATGQPHGQDAGQPHGWNAEPPKQRDAGIFSGMARLRGVAG